MQALGSKRRLMQNQQGSVYELTAKTTADGTSLISTVQSSTFKGTIQSAVTNLSVTVQNIGELPLMYGLSATAGTWKQLCTREP